MALLVRVRVPPLYTPPPLEAEFAPPPPTGIPAELFEIALLVRVAVPMLYTPPPLLKAALPETVLLVRVRGPLPEKPLCTPPPSPPVPLVPARAILPETVLLIRVKMPRLSTPPPTLKGALSAATPPVRVSYRLESQALAWLFSCRTAFLT